MRRIELVLCAAVGTAIMLFMPTMWLLSLTSTLNTTTDNYTLMIALSLFVPFFLITYHAGQNVLPDDLYNSYSYHAFLWFMYMALGSGYMNGGYIDVEAGLILFVKIGLPFIVVALIEHWAGQRWERWKNQPPEKAKNEALKATPTTADTAHLMTIDEVNQGLYRETHLATRLWGKNQ